MDRFGYTPQLMVPALSLKGTSALIYIISHPTVFVRKPCTYCLFPRSLLPNVTRSGKHLSRLLAAIWRTMSPASGTCVRCQKPTRNRCTRCLEAPIHDGCVSKSRFYWYAEKLVGASTSQIAKSFKLARHLVEPPCFSKPSSTGFD